MGKPLHRAESEKHEVHHALPNGRILGLGFMVLFLGGGARNRDSVAVSVS